MAPPAKRPEHERHESRDAPPAQVSEIHSLSDVSGDGDAIELEEAPMRAPQVESSAEEDMELYYSIQVVQALLSSACDDGHARIAQLNYGLLRTEPYQPELWEAHRNVLPSYDRADDEWYVNHTIDWLIKKVCSIPLRTSSAGG